MAMTLVTSVTLETIVYFRHCYILALDAIVEEHLFSQSVLDAKQSESHLVYFLLLGHYGSIIAQRCLGQGEHGRFIDKCLLKELQGRGKLIAHFCHNKA